MTTAHASYVIKRPEDLLAAVPVFLGFEPADSVVMLTFGGPHSFQARLDLPAPRELDRFVDQLLGPARAHRARAVFFVVYSGDPRLSRDVCRALAKAFGAARIRVIDFLRVADGRWFTPLGGTGVPDHGVPFDVSAHPFRAQAVLDGRVTAASRAELAERLASDSAAAERVAAALPGADPLDEAGVQALVMRCLESGRAAQDVEVAALLLGLVDDDVTMAVCCALRRACAESQLDLWADVVRRAPTALLPEAAAVFAFTAWLAGNGALAWCGVDRSREAGGHPLADLVDGLLEGAVPPAAWQGGLRAMPGATDG